MSFTDLKWVIKPEITEEVDGVITVIEKELSLTYGNFIQQVIDFLIISLSIFVVLRLMMTLKSAFEKKEEAKAEEPAPVAPPAPSEELVTLREIRDLLKK
jgi:large conductance mechanosensitive channel